jgi:hypothetical protein
MPEEKKKFEDMSGESGNIISEFVEFLKHNKKLWLLPIIIVLILLGLLIMLGGTSAAPFIYTLF